VPRHLVAGKLKKELAKQRLFSLPPVLKGESIRELKKIRQQYKKEQLLSLFQYRLENMDTHDYTRHIFAVRIAHFSFCFDLSGRLLTWTTVPNGCSQGVWTYLREQGKRLPQGARHL